MHKCSSKLSDCIIITFSFVLSLVMLNDYGEWMSIDVSPVKYSDSDNKLRCLAHFQFSANQITWSRLLIQIHILNGKQCRSWSVGFFRRSEDLDLYCLQRQGMSEIGRSWVKFKNHLDRISRQQTGYFSHFFFCQKIGSEIYVDSSKTILKEC